jgi:hypothetical protein
VGTQAIQVQEFPDIQAIVVAGFPVIQDTQVLAYLATVVIAALVQAGIQDTPEYQATVVIAALVSQVIADILVPA